ncbi:hypothetical protein FGG08_007536 [Glutinoglossum americanum]|uniref:Uncharacterized protein n=1 Tax=Glutinoglossum americanum TaxID=1670608 RepID=A0A9P8HZ81_9PEZI|nr:hypothetical protein FGG08_007536 [Glutinoglossum americanum]
MRAFEAPSEEGTLAEPPLPKTGTATHARTQNDTRRSADGGHTASRLLMRHLEVNVSKDATGGATTRRVVHRRKAGGGEARAKRVSKPEGQWRENTYQGDTRGRRTNMAGLARGAGERSSRGGHQTATLGGDRGGHRTVALGGDRGGHRTAAPGGDREGPASDGGGRTSDGGGHSDADPDVLGGGKGENEHRSEP